MKSMRSQTKLKRLAILVLPLFLIFGCTSTDDGTDWQLVWSDEFDGAEGATLDQSKWNFEIGRGQNGWGNNELQYYTDRSENVSLDRDGNLIITAREENFEGANYTSARITTQDKLEITYGRIEARIKTPFGQGLWPAFWLLGTSNSGEIWPQIGEIDVMELRGQQPTKIASTAHGPGYSAGNGISGDYTLSNSRFDTEFHVFAAEWFTDKIDFYVDGFLHHTVTKEQIENAGNEWVYNDPFFLILNVAVGGNYVGSPNQTTRFPQTLIIDYVRVYSE
ncbi:MAG TPA: glycosyl hydrolase family 16 [Balneola sp.]|jgi:beta-glucanase (GH16 family)|nr:glycosyl hydrolase family 16 [Balneola sp.]MAO78993.1 glycosyl hydrolase family 16 [Balneola sp.]MBF63652.1 glycosyl hydrolase family 16 [Balneola sp.]HBZ40034.1 glycosyl hydrolase family 16 [Balneola sp.]|tara:strand:- start:3976 stop:4809 length:834 start_codon:yes stop_codon:yes gene_type:complete